MSTPSTISRRTLTKGAAWSVPVIALASAAPAAAASGHCTVSRLGGSIWDEVVSDTRVEFGVFVQVLAHPACTGDARSVQLSLAFALASPYTSWRSADLTLRSGTGAGPFHTTVNASFTDIADSWLVAFEAEKETGADPTPIAFTLSAPGAQSVVITAFA